MTQTAWDWDDARLDAAFAARAGLARSTPPDLAISVLARIASRPSRPTVGVRRLAPGLGLAAAIAVAIVIGSAQIARTPPATSSSPNASAVAASVVPASPEPTASPAVPVSAVDDLLAHPISVSDAIARRDANLDDTEIAVKGFAWYPSAALDCISDTAMPATFRGCERRYTWLATTADTQAMPVPISLEPMSPAFNLFIQPETVGASLIGREPTHVIAVGHFDDHRARLCSPEQVEACSEQCLDCCRPSG